jgi:hypothetical protein
MPHKKLSITSRYIVLETIPKDLSSNTLNDYEWRIVEDIFKNHPELIKIWAPSRDTEL